MQDFRLQVGTMDLWDLEQLRKSFDYHEPCIRMWENCRPLRERAIQGKSLVASVHDAVQPTPPSLENMSKNHTLLKGFTSYMADTGVICTNHVDPVKKAVVGFYTLMQCDVETDAGVTVCHDVAKSIKRMLTIIRFKWRRWEMPREPWLNSINAINYYCPWSLFSYFL